MKKFGPIRYLRGIAVSLVVSTLMPLLMVMTRENVEFYDSTTESVVRTSSCLCNGVSEKFIDTFYISSSPGLTWNVSFKPFDPQLISVSEVVGGYKVAISSSYRKAYEISIVSSKNEYVTLKGGDCGYAIPIIQGLNSLCLSSNGTYSIQSQDNYTFSISGGGTLTNLGQNRVEINWGSTAGTYTITAVNSTNPCTPDLKLDVAIGSAYTGVLACNSQVNIGLDSTCESKVLLSDVFIGQNTVGTALSLVLKLKDGTIVPNNVLSKEHIGKEIVAHIVDGCGNNSCWGNVLLEDKMAPAIICTDSIEMECYNLQINSAIVAAEDCSNYTIHQIGSDERTNLTCDPNYIARITRNFQARDQFGNTSAVCTVVMEIKRFPLDSVTFPTDLKDNISVDCNSLVSGTILPTLSGYPKINHLVLDKSNYPECNLLISYADQIIKLPTKTKIIRTWEILEPHCNVMNRRTHKQLIEVSDKVAPVIAKCIDNINITTDAHQCLGIFKLPTIAASAISDNCSSGFSHQIVINNVGTKNAGEAIALTIGDYAAQYIVSDESGNTATCNFSINVSDKTPPVAICKEFVVMSLSAGGGYITSAMINNGSKDECSLTSVLIRRMSDSTDRPFRDTIHVTCADVEKPFMVMLQATDQAGNINTCMTTLTAQDKSIPVLEVPSDRTITCAQWSTNKDLKTYGEAIAFDQCNFTIEETVSYNLNNCQVGTIVRTFTAKDASHTVVKTQTITVQNSTLADFSTIVAPRDTILRGMCNMKSLHPDSLTKYGRAYGRPIVPINSCVNLGITYKDEIYTVQSPANQNCFKVIRIWKIINWCEAPGNVYELKQTIAVENNIPPSITTPRNDTLFHTENCNAGDFSLSASGSDDCTPDDLLSWSWKVENQNNMTVANGTAQGKTINLVRSLPAGNYTFIWTLRDGCGNLKEATHKFRIKYSKGASFFVVDTVAVALAPNDSTNSACITAKPLVQSASHACGLSVKYSFSATTPNQDTICMNCKDLGYRAVTVYAHDANGVVTSARTIVHVQDNNKIRNCSNTNECVTWPRDTTINACVPNIRPQDIRSVPIIDPNCNCTSTTTTFSDRPIASNAGECTVIERTHFVTFRCNGITTTFSEVQRIIRRNATSPTLVCLQNRIMARSTSNCAATVTVQGPTVSNTTCHTGLTTTYQIGTNPVQSGSSFTSSFNVGNTAVVFTVTDACGNSSTCTVNVEVTDGEAPICSVRDVTVFLNVQGEATITNPAIFDNGSRGACGPSSLTFAADRTQFNCSNLNTPVQVRLTVTGSNNQSTTCTANVMVRDTVKPTLITRNIIKEISGINQTITVSKQELVVAASDNCVLGDTTLSRSQFTFQNLGVNNVTVILRDAQGNETRVEAIVNIVDRVPPTCNLRDVTIFVNNQGQATITDPTIFNAGLNTARFSVNRTNFTCTDIGRLNPVFVTITNDLGVSMICDANVIVRDTIKPLLTTRNITKEITSLNQVIRVTKQELIQSASDNCALGDTTLSISEFRCQNAGANTVTVTLRDSSGNTTTATAIVTIVDRVPPTCNLRDVTIFVNNQGQALISDASIFRAGAGASCSAMDIVSYSVDKTTFNCTDIGRSNPVKVTVSDELGISMICDANVIVSDTIKPLLTTRNITKEITSLNQVISITKQELIQSASDNCSLGDTSLSISEFRCQNAGANTVTVTLRDSSGNTTTATAIVTIVDRVPPTCNLRDVTIFVNNQGQALISDASIFRAGDGASCSGMTIISYTVDKTTFNCVDIGRPNPVKVTVRDALSNSMICDANVIVRDTIKPLLTTRNITKEITSLNQVISITKQELIQSATDNCSLGDTSLSISEFRCQNAGANTVTVTLRDSSGNTTTATAIITIVDRVPPTCNLRDVTIFVNNQGQALISDASIFRAGDGASCSGMSIVSYTVDKATFNCGDIGRPNPVKVTVRDALGNSMICDANVTVRDTLAPLVTPKNFDLAITNNESVTIKKSDLIASIDENCSVSDTIISKNTFTCENLGSNRVTVIVVDDFGNRDTVETTVTVIDRQAPICRVRNVSILLNAQGQATIGDASVFNSGSFDECNSIPLNFSVDKTQFTCANLGANNPVMITVSDATGNSSTCPANVTVQDTIRPRLVVRNIERTISNVNSSVVVNASDLIMSSSDNCSIVDSANAPSIFTCANLGNNTVRVVVRDASGNTGIAESIVTILDGVAPECRLKTATVMVNGGTTTIDSSTINNDSFDPCGTIVTFKVSPNTFTCSDVGVRSVTATITDAAGNITICDTTITVVDGNQLICIPKDITVSLGANNTVTITANDVDGGSGTGCGNPVEKSISRSTFSCSDVGTPQNVTLTITRPGTNQTSTCTARVTVISQGVPSFICTVEKVDVACEEYDGINIPASIPRPRIANSCGGNFKLDSVIIRLPRNCNLDTLTRTYLLFDNNDNLLSTCVQSINIVNNKLLTIDSFDLPSTNITLPSCADKRPEVTGGRMRLKQGVSVGCADIDISFRDTFLTNTCNDTLRRIWTAVDKCGSITPISFTQKIAIIDTFAPVITGVRDTIIFNQGDCGVQINFTNIKVDDCDTRLTLTNNSPQARNNNGIDPSGFYPIGIYTIALSATDACNNSSQASFRVEVRDTSSQVFACRNVERIIQPTGIVSVNARELVGYFGNNCASTFNARVVMSRQGLDTVSSKVYTCDNLTLVGQELLKRDTLTIQVYSGNTLLHSCSAVLTIKAGGNCQNFFALKNNVRTITEEVVPNFSISLMTGGKELVKKMTDDKGQTTINAPQGVDMMIVPFKNDDHLNGVNTLDLVQMQRHILGISKFRSPYHMIAADVNNDKKISISDIVEMRSLILGVKENFSNHTSWVAIDGDYSFASVDGALEEDYPQHLELDQINKDMDLSFVGVKIGDVDVSYTASALQKNIQQRSKAIELSLLDKDVKIGQTFELELDLSQYNAIGAEISIALAQAELLEISGKDWISGQTANQLKLINYNAQSLDKVSLKLRALQSGKISDFIEMESGEIYTNDLGKNKVQIAWNAEDIGQAELKVYPNPLHERATISIISDKEEDTAYLITDQLGKVVLKNTIHINKGQNLIELSRSSLNGNGVYFLIMKVGGEQKSTKLIVTE